MLRQETSHCENKLAQYLKFHIRKSYWLITGTYTADAARTSFLGLMLQNQQGCIFKNKHQKIILAGKSNLACRVLEGFLWGKFQRINVRESTKGCQGEDIQREEGSICEALKWERAWHIWEREEYIFLVWVLSCYSFPMLSSMLRPVYNLRLVTIIIFLSDFLCLTNSTSKSSTIWCLLFLPYCLQWTAMFPWPWACWLKPWYLLTNFPDVLFLFLFFVLALRSGISRFLALRFLIPLHCLSLHGKGNCEK